MRMATINEAALLLDVTPARLRRGIKSGRYPALEWGDRLLVDVEALSRIISEERHEMPGGGAVDVRVCAAAVGLSIWQLRRMARAGLVPYGREGRRYIFDIEAVKKALTARMK